MGARKNAEEHFRAGATAEQSPCRWRSWQMARIEFARRTIGQHGSILPRVFLPSIFRQDARVVVWAYSVAPAALI